MSADGKPDLSPFQMKHLRRLGEDPGVWVPSATLSKLRKLGLVGKVVGRDDRGHQKTTSPVTDAGRALLGGLS